MRGCLACQPRPCSSPYFRLPPILSRQEPLRCARAIISRTEECVEKGRGPISKPCLWLGTFLSCPQKAVGCRPLDLAVDWFGTRTVGSSDRPHGAFAHRTQSLCHLPSLLCPRGLTPLQCLRVHPASSSQPVRSSSTPFRSKYTPHVHVSHNTHKSCITPSPHHRHRPTP